MQLYGLWDTAEVYSTGELGPGGPLKLEQGQPEFERIEDLLYALGHKHHFRPFVIVVRLAPRPVLA